MRKYIIYKAVHDREAMNLVEGLNKIGLGKLFSNHGRLLIFEGEGKEDWMPLINPVIEKFVEQLNGQYDAYKFTVQTIRITLDDGIARYWPCDTHDERFLEFELLPKVGIGFITFGRVPFEIYVKTDSGPMMTWERVNLHTA